MSTLFGRWRNSPHPAQKSATPPRPFQAIGIYHGIVCCAAARDIEGSRFLARNAPQLPLRDCTMPAKCTCKYLKFLDRRSSSRRLIDYGVKPTIFDAKERRKLTGRRIKD